MNSLKRIESKTIPRGSILIVESPDRASRQRFSEAYPTYQRILSAGIEIHFLSIRDVLKPEHSFTNILRVGVEIDRANCESVLKSERVGEAWSKKRETCKRQNGHERPRSSLVEAAKGQHIQVIPERPAIVKKIFEWAAKGLGQYLICDKLLAPILPYGDRFTKASLRGGRIAMSVPFSVPEVSSGNTSPTQRN